MRTNLRTEHGGKTYFGLVEFFVGFGCWLVGLGLVLFGGRSCSETQFIVYEEAQNTSALRKKLTVV